MYFNSDLFDNVPLSGDSSDNKTEPFEDTNVSQAKVKSKDDGVETVHEDSIKSESLKNKDKRKQGRPGRPRTGKMERVMCYFPKDLLDDMNHFSEEAMISRNAFIITCIVKHIRELKKEENNHN